MQETKCPQCGGVLRYEPGTINLKCPYCSTEFPIVQEHVEVQEWDFDEQSADLEDQAEVAEAETVKCSECGAEIVLPPNVTADVCPYCASSLVAEEAILKKAIKPRYLLPFGTTAKQTNDLFRKWIAGLWFAPGDLKKLARTDEAMKGLYTPYWTYDADTYTAYEGQRGDYYYETVTYMALRNGREVPETRTIQKIRWTPVEGAVDLSFDDVLVLGSKSLPPDYAESLEPWDLPELVGYNEKYLSGFLSESYQIGPKDGFDAARARMNPVIIQAIRADIGGDVQQIHSAATRCGNVKFKHILLPVWIRSYRFRNKIYRFLVNARTGEIQGDRPWSWIKLTLFGAAISFAVICVYLISSGN
jgi:DNA-directed RNA polymerase subunit RPC12/RpoP